MLIQIFLTMQLWYWGVKLKSSLFQELATAFGWILGKAFSLETAFTKSSRKGNTYQVNFLLYLFILYVHVFYASESH